MGTLLVILTLGCSVALLLLSTRHAVRAYGRDMRQAAWPWAQAYYALRDDDDETERRL